MVDLGEDEPIGTNIPQFHMVFRKIFKNTYSWPHPPTRNPKSIPDTCLKSVFLAHVGVFISHSSVEVDITSIRRSIIIFCQL